MSMEPRSDLIIDRRILRPEVVAMQRLCSPTHLQRRRPGEGEPVLFARANELTQCGSTGVVCLPKVRGMGDLVEWPTPGAGAGLAPLPTRAPAEPPPRRTVVSNLMLLSGPDRQLDPPVRCGQLARRAPHHRSPRWPAPGGGLPDPADQRGSPTSAPSEHLDRLATRPGLEGATHG